MDSAPPEVTRRRSHPKLNSSICSYLFVQPKLSGKNKVSLVLPKSEDGTVTIVPYMITLKTTEDCEKLIKIIDDNKPKKD